MSAQPRVEASKLHHALKYADAGWRVIPLQGKIPRTRNGSTGGTLDIEQIQKWWTLWPDADIGICTGAESSLCVIDIDPDHGGAETFARLEKKLGALDRSLAVKTGGGGFHLYCAWPEQGEVRNSQSNPDWSGVDVRGRGGFVVAPGSVHDSGQVYEWIGEGFAQGLAPGTLPAPWLRELVTRARVNNEAREATTAVAMIPEGKRHAYMVSEIGRMYGLGHAYESVRAFIETESRLRFQPPATEDEIDQAFKGNEHWRETDVDVTRVIAEVPVSTVDEARANVAGLEAAQKSDPGAVFNPLILKSLVILEKEDPSEFQRAKAAAKKGGALLGDLKPQMAAMRKAMARQEAQRSPGGTAFDMPIKDMTVPAPWSVFTEGVFYNDEERGLERVLSAPLTIARHLSPVGEGDEQVELAYVRHGETVSTVCELTTSSVSRNITALANRGVEGLTSNSGARVVQYLTDLAAANKGIIPVERYTQRAGWIGSSRFFPGAADGVSFAPGDGSDLAERDFASHGNIDEWGRIVDELRQKSPLFRAMIAASFAAPLLNMVGHRSFVMHVWGASASGKTAALKAAMSVWGNPHKLTGNFSTTMVGLEHRLAMFNGLPTAIDERQVASKFFNIDQMIYMVGEGKGKTRGAQAGGNRYTPEWKTIAMTTGEEPLTGPSSPDGTRTRTLEMYGVTIEDEAAAGRLYDAIDANYGHAGRKYIQWLIEKESNGGRLVSADFDGMKLALAREDRLATHVGICALIACGDMYASQAIWGLSAGDACEQAAGLSLGLLGAASHKQEQAESSHEYAFICDLVTSQQGHFQKGFGGDYPDCEMWGVVEEGVVYFISSVFKREIEREGMRCTPAKGRLADRGLMLVGEDRGNRELSIKRNGKRWIAVKIPIGITDMITAGTTSKWSDRLNY